MRVVTFVSRPSRSGKTTLAAHLAVEAGLRGAGPVALIDLDPQAALTKWWNQRESDTPLLAQTTPETLGPDLARLAQAGVKLAIIDTGADSIAIHDAVAAADLVLIPARPGPQGLFAAASTVELIGCAGKAIVFLLNGVTSTTRISGESLAALSQHGPLAPAIIHESADFAAAMANGRTVVEIPALSPARRQIEALWKFVDERTAPVPAVPAPSAAPAADDTAAAA
jgi:chromosome partitioning protein